mmetsp:Transcript_28484/g.85034  ORF Transcript_28484/g.85034 Transcript_28484/m.85034 type:complete len:189 (-) Transcript_28484:116-682(-)
MPPGHTQAYFKAHADDPRYQRPTDPVARAESLRASQSLWPLARSLGTVIGGFALFFVLYRFFDQRYRSRLKSRVGEKLRPIPPGLELSAARPLRAASEGSARRAAGEAERRLVMGEIGAQLAACKLDRYLDAFEEHGYDDWDEIQSMGEARLQRLVERVGLSSNHADRFLAHVAQAVAERVGAGGVLS